MSGTIIPYVTLGFEFGFGIIASIFGLSTGPVEAAILECQAAVFAEVMAAAACDPDPCRTIEKYWLLAAPNIPKRRHPCTRKTVERLFEGPITDETLKLFQDAIDATLRIPAYTLAVMETCSRVYSAHQKADLDNESNQRRFKAMLIEETNVARREAADRWERLLHHCGTHGIAGRKVEGYEAFVATLKRDGFHEIEVAVMKSYGLSDADIERARRIFLDNFGIKLAPRTVEEAISRSLVAYRFRPCTCECA